MCVFAIACALKWGVAFKGELIYCPFLTPLWENIFRHRRSTRRGNTFKTLVMKKGQIWLIHVFFNILDRISSFVYVHEKFCNKKLFLDLLSIVLIEFPGFYCLWNLYKGSSSA